MVLKTIEENKGWIRCSWQCAFPMMWPNILFAVRAMSITFEDPEVLAGEKGGGGERINPMDRPPEKGLLVLRGYSKHFKGKIAINFATGTNDVTILIPKTIGFRAEYQYLSEALGPFMDNIELKMYAGK